jgi:AcrR family transcriptional regulator
MSRSSTRTYAMTARAEGAEATRERIVVCALELLFEHWFEDVTLAAIARAAGVSHQTVLNHFGSKEGVVLAAAEVLRAETHAARGRAKPGDVKGAVRILVGEYERFGDANARWAATSERLRSLAPLIEEARAGHQTWLGHVFGPRLPAAPARRRRAINALHAATDVYTWKLLRRDLGLTRAETERTMTGLAMGVLEPIPDDSAVPPSPRTKETR